MAAGGNFRGQDVSRISLALAFEPNVSMAGVWAPDTMFDDADAFWLDHCERAELVYGHAPTKRRPLSAEECLGETAYARECPQRSRQE